MYPWELLWGSMVIDAVAAAKKFEGHHGTSCCTSTVDRLNCFHESPILKLKIRQKQEMIK